MSIAEEMQRDWDSLDSQKTSPLSIQKQSAMAEEETSDRQHQFMSNAIEDLGSALYDWCKGAVAGAEEVGRAASARGANVPAEYLDEYVSDKDKPELTPEQQQVEDWYQKAVNTFNDETTKPVMVAAALSGLPGVSQLGAMAMLPMLGEDWSKNVEKEGVISGTASTALNMLPIIGSYRQASDPNFQAYAEAHPARAAGLLLMNEAPWLAGAVQASKTIRFNDYVEKFKGNIKKAKEAFKKEEAAISSKAKGEETILANVRRDTKFKPEKPKNPREEVNMSEKPKVAKEIDKSIYDKAVEKEAVDIQAEKTYKGAYDTDINTIPPSDMSITSVSIREIYDTANSIITSRIGNLVTKSKNTLGHYRPLEQIVNVKDTLDLTTLAHEVGHHIDTVLNIMGFDKELIDAAKSRWGTAYDKQEAKVPGTWRKEGIAEFTTEYALNPAVAQQNFPGYYGEFVKKIAQHPELAEKFERLCQQIRLWKTMRPEERVRGNMVFATDAAPAGRAISNFLNNFNAFRKAWIDENINFKNLIEDWVDRKSIALLNSENPALQAAAVKNFAPARSTLLLGFFHKLGDDVGISALEKVYNVPLKKMSLGTIYNKLKDLQVDKGVIDYLNTNKQYKSIHEAFSTYSTALHNLDVIDMKNAERIVKLNEKLKDLQQELSKFPDIASLSAEIDKLTIDLLNAKPQNIKELLIKQGMRKELREKVAELIAKKPSRSDKAKIKRLKKKIDDADNEINSIISGDNDYKAAASREEFQAVVDNAPAQFKKLSQDLSDVTENLMTLMVHFGFVSAKEAAELRRKYPHYVPLHRDFSIDRLLGNAGSSGTKGKGVVNVDSPLRALSEEGSTRTVLDPITELYKTTNLLIEAGERNKVGQSLAKLAKLDGAGELLVEAGESPKAVRGIFSVWIDGKKKNYQAIVPGLYEAVVGNNNAVSLGALDVITNVLRKGATALRVGATSTPAFMMWNGIRDTLTASLYSKTGMLPVIGTLDGFFKRMDKQLMADFMAQGVPFATFIGSNKDITRMFNKTTKQATRADKAFNIATAPFRLFEHLNEATEQAPRLAEFKRMYDRLLKQGYSEQEALFVAGQQARDLTVNFSQAGTYGKEVNKYAAFFNAAVQGNYKLVAALGSDAMRAAKIFNDIRKGRTQPMNAVEKVISDVKTGKITFAEAVKKAPLGTTAWALTSITLPSLVLWSINHDKDWYRDLPYHEKMTNWFLEIADGIILRFPKPELPGYMFGSIPERIMDKAMDEDPQAVLNSTMGMFLFDSVMTSGMPTAILPILEWKTNWSFFRDRPIVDAKHKDDLPEDQYNIYTSEMAKYAGQTLGWSPMKIDNAFRDVTGSLGSFFLGVTDRILKNEKFPDRDWRDLTRFTHNPIPNSRSRSAEVFYDNLEKAKQKHKHEVRISLRKPKQKSKELKILESAKNELSKQYEKKSQIMEGSGKFAELSTAQRKVEKDSVEEKINSIQRNANNRIGYRYVPLRK